MTNNFIADVRRRAAAAGATIVLPEGGEPRMYHAARTLTDEGVCKVIICGEPSTVSCMAKQEGVGLDGIEIADPASDARREQLASRLHQQRAKKGMTLPEAREQVNDPLYFGALLVREGFAEGMVAGALNATANVMRAAFHCVGTAPGISVVSSVFVMIVPDCPYGADGTLVFADCAINPNPDAAQLADIAISSARTAQALCDIEPKVAMLSFSTMGSGGDHPDVLKVREALAIIRDREPELAVTGEMQADAALIESIGAKKAPGDPVAGKANVLIFPDLDAGNIAYKLVQRLAKAEAVGPVSQGLAWPINDLSRGCSVDDIVNVAAITILQSKHHEE